MVNRELSEKLDSGEILTINLGGTAPENAVQKKSDVDTVVANYTTTVDLEANYTTTTDIASTYETIVNVDAINTRVTAIESSHTELINGASTQITQTPIANTALKVEFGTAQTSTEVDLSAIGDITFKEAGKYIITTFFQYGRTGVTAGEAVLLSRIMLNSVQMGNTMATKIENNNTIVPWSSSIQVTVAANDVMHIEVAKDSTGVDEGGLIAVTPGNAGWALAPTAAIQIYKAI